VDVPQLLRTVRGRRGWSQAQLAAFTGWSRSAIGDYEAGRKSPTVATLNRILAASGLQIRAELEPLRAELEARVDAVLADLGPLDQQVIGDVARVAQALEGVSFAWGLDGETALRLHGYGFPSERVQLGVCFDDAARACFFRQRVRGTGSEPVSWFDSEITEAQAYLGGMAFGPFGMVAVRLLDQPPPTVRVEVAPGLVVPVLTVDEVARGRPDLAEVLERLRARSLEA
jgi:transcriptional regulator with XRE-family HTH domain